MRFDNDAIRFGNLGWNCLNVRLSWEVLVDNYTPSVSVSASVGRPSSGPFKKNPHILQWIVAEMTDLKLLLWASCKVQDWSLSGKLWGSLEESESLIASTVFWNIFYWNGLLCTHGMLDIACNNYVYHNNQSRQLKWLMKLSLFWGNYEPKICLTCKQITCTLFR